MHFQSKEKDKYKIALIGAVVACIVWFLFSFFYGEGFSSVLFSDQNDMFMDFFNCIAGYGGNPYLGDYPTNYPPMAVLFFQMIRNAMPQELFDLTSYEMRMQQTPMMMYFFYTILVSVIVTGTYVNKVRMESGKKQLLFLFLVLGFPTLFSFERGNISNLAFALTVFYVGYYSDENPVLRHLAYIALGIATAIKIYPAVFTVLLLKDKKFKEVLCLIGYEIVLFFWPFWSFGGIDAIGGFIKGLTSFASSRSAALHGNEIMVIHEELVAGLTSQSYSFAKALPDAYGFNFSFKSMINVFATIIGRDISPVFLNILFFLVVGFLLLYTFVSKEKWKTLLGCALLILLVPAFSCAYGVPYLYIPMVSLVVEKNGGTSAKVKGRKGSKDFTIFILLLLLFIPWRFPEIAGFSGEIYYRGMTYSFLLYFGLVFYILLFCVDDFCDNFIREKLVHRAIVIALFAILLWVTILVVLNCFLFV